MPLLKHPSKGWDRPLLTTLTGYLYGEDTDHIPTDPTVLRQTGNVPWYVSLHDGRFKYIRTLVAGEIEELYDLDVDPEELVNLVRDPVHRKRVIQMRQNAIDELRRTEAGYVDQLPPVAELAEK